MHWRLGFTYEKHEYNNFEINLIQIVYTKINFPPINLYTQRTHCILAKKKRSYDLPHNLLICHIIPSQDKSWDIIHKVSEYTKAAHMRHKKLTSKKPARRWRNKPSVCICVHFLCYIYSRKGDNREQVTRLCVYIMKFIKTPIEKLLPASAIFFFVHVI